MKKVKLFLMGLVAIATLSAGLSSCGGGSSNSSSNSSEAQQETPSISTEVEDVYNFVNRKTFEASYSERGGGGSVLKLHFNCKSKTGGTIKMHILTWEAERVINGIQQGGNSARTEDKEVSFQIRDDGSIVTNAMTLKKDGRYLVSNWDNGQGGYIKFKR
jgi:hypothetical protein